MGHFLAERYVSATDETSLNDDTARLSASDGSDARLVFTVYLPADECCLHLFDAGSLAAVEQISRQAGVVFDQLEVALRVPSEVLGGEEIR
jgi:hypothetical protein